MTIMWKARSSLTQTMIYDDTVHNYSLDWCIYIQNLFCHNRHFLEFGERIYTGERGVWQRWKLRDGRGWKLNMGKEGTLGIIFTGDRKLGQLGIIDVLQRGNTTETFFAVCKLSFSCNLHVTGARDILWVIA